MDLVHGKVGIVSEIDPEKCKAKVTFPADNFVTDWLYIERLNGFYAIPQINETVVVWLDKEFDKGVILGSVYTESIPSPYTNKNLVGFKLPGIEIKIDAETKDIFVIASNVTFEADTITMTTDKLKISGDIELGGDISAEGKIDAIGVIKSTTDVQTATVKLNTHVHPTSSPGAPTAPPIPG